MTANLSSTCTAQWDSCRFHSFKAIRSSLAILTLVIVISAILWWIFCLKHFFFDQFSNCSTTTQSLAQRNRMWLMITGCHFKRGWMIYKINFRQIWMICPLQVWWWKNIPNSSQRLNRATRGCHGENIDKASWKSKSPNHILYFPKQKLGFCSD